MAISIDLTPQSPKTRWSESIQGDSIRRHRFRSKSFGAGNSRSSTHTKLKELASKRILSKKTKSQLNLKSLFMCCTSVDHYQDPAASWRLRAPADKNSYHSSISEKPISSALECHNSLGIAPSLSISTLHSSSMIFPSIHSLNQRAAQNHYHSMEHAAKSDQGSCFHGRQEQTKTMRRQYSQSSLDTLSSSTSPPQMISFKKAATDLVSTDSTAQVAKRVSPSLSKLSVSSQYSDQSRREEFEVASPTSTLFEVPTVEPTSLGKPKPSNSVRRRRRHAMPNLSTSTLAFLDGIYSDDSPVSPVTPPAVEADARVSLSTTQSSTQRDHTSSLIDHYLQQSSHETDETSSLKLRHQSTFGPLSKTSGGLPPAHAEENIVTCETDNSLDEAVLEACLLAAKIHLRNEEIRTSSRGADSVDLDPYNSINNERKKPSRLTFAASLPEMDKSEVNKSNDPTLSTPMYDAELHKQLSSIVWSATRRSHARKSSEGSQSHNVSSYPSMLSSSTRSSSRPGIDRSLVCSGGSTTSSFYCGRSTPVFPPPNTALPPIPSSADSSPCTSRRGSMKTRRTTFGDHPDSMAYGIQTLRRISEDGKTLIEEEEDEEEDGEGEGKPLNDRFVHSKDSLVDVDSTITESSQSYKTKSDLATETQPRMLNRRPSYGFGSGSFRSAATFASRNSSTTTLCDPLSDSNLHTTTANATSFEPSPSPGNPMEPLSLQCIPLCPPFQNPTTTTSKTWKKLEKLYDSPTKPTIRYQKPSEWKTMSNYISTAHTLF